MTRFYPILFRPRGILTLVGLSLLAVLLAFPARSALSPKAAPSLPAHIGGVHGTITVADPGGPPPKYVALPDHILRLHDKATGNQVAQTTSDVYGRYYFPPQPFGTYELRWPTLNGWATGVYPEDIVILQGTVNPRRIELTPGFGKKSVVGQVSLNNGSVPGLVDEYFGIEDTPSVSLRTSSGALISGPVRSNAEGRYAITVSKKTKGSARVRAEIGSASVLTPLGSSFGTSIHRDLVLPNAPPQITSLYLANSAGKGVRRANSGQVLNSQDNIFDPDGDAISISWRPEYASGAANLSQTGNQAFWTVPTINRGSKLFAVVSDGRGGYVRESLNMGINQPREIFSGTLVSRSTGKPIGGGSIEINGEFTESGKTGFWSMEVPAAEQYLVNIRHRDYALAGQTFDRGSMGRVWRMVPRKAQWVDPRELAVVVDDRPELQERPGATIYLPPNSLVDPQGNLPQGMLRVSFATLDIANGEAVGNWGARTDEGETGLISYGVISIEVTDEEGREYQVRKGSAARFTIPLVGGLEGQKIPKGAPETIPVWSYMEEEGFWRETGSATLNPDSAVYEGEVTHFSEINLDVTGADSTIRVLCDPSLVGMWLRVSDVPFDGIDYTNVKEGELDDPLSAIWMVPPSQLVRLEVIDGPGGNLVSGVVIDRFDSANPALGHVQLAGTDVLVGPTAPTLYPPYPYSDCPITVTLKWQSQPSNSFLHYKGVGTLADATAYYNQMNLAGNRDTLQDWWATNGFNVDGSATPGAGEDYARTSYMNNNDLGSGRDMHLFSRANGTTMAWVANYGQFNQSHANADLALAAVAPGATVCMEFSPMENAAGDFVDAAGVLVNALDPVAVQAASVTKFFVFADLDAFPGDELQTSADLDGYGNKFVPNLCLNCHGGSANPPYTNAASGQLNAYFRELDYNTYKFPAGALVPSAAEKAAFKTQNEIVYDSATSLVSSAAIKEIIDIWYQGGASDVDQDDCLQPGGITDPTSIPAGWYDSGNLAFGDFYCDVVGKSCRTCHLAHDGIPFNTNAGFADGEFMEFYLDFFVNNPPATGIMPHAIITYRNFWLEDGPFRPQAAIDFLSNN